MWILDTIAIVYCEERETAEKKIEAEKMDSSVFHLSFIAFQDLRRKAEKEESPWEWKDARDKAVDTLEKEEAGKASEVLNRLCEEKLDSAKRRLESLTGQPVKDRQLFSDCFQMA